MKQTMETSRLAPGLKISRVLTGLWQLADMEREGRVLDLDAAAGAMSPYIRAGLTTFDMADHYGAAEDVVGRFVQRVGDRDDIEIATKWVPQPGVVNRETVRRAVTRALERLRVSSIDLMQFHAWRYSDPSYLDALQHLQELKGEGRIRRLGLTNFDTAHLRIVLASGLDVVSNQVCFSLLDRRAQGAMSTLCQRHGVRLLAYGTLAGGLLTDRFLDRPEPAELETWSEMKYKRFLDVAGGWDRLQELLRTLRSVADRHSVSIANVASRYVLEQPAVAGIIIGARLGESEHIEETLRLFDFALGEEDRSRIEAALKGFRPIPGDCGDEYRQPPYLTAVGDLSHHLEEFPPPYEIHTDAVGRRRVLSGTHWEEEFGYCRAIREGSTISVAGTTASHGDHLIGGTDAVAQTHFVIDKIEGALQSLGARLQDVIRTRIYVANLDDWERVAGVHGERFAGIRPANTLVQTRLVGEEFLVEIEADAVVSGVSDQGHEHRERRD